MPSVQQTAALRGLRPVAKALGASVGRDVEPRHGLAGGRGELADDPVEPRGLELADRAGAHGAQGQLVAVPVRVRVGAQGDDERRRSGPVRPKKPPMTMMSADRPPRSTAVFSPLCRRCTVALQGVRQGNPCFAPPSSENLLSRSTRDRATLVPLCARSADGARCGAGRGTSAPGGPPYGRYGASGRARRVRSTVCRAPDGTRQRPEAQREDQLRRAERATPRTAARAMAAVTPPGRGCRGRPARLSRRPPRLRAPSPRKSTRGPPQVVVRARSRR